MCGEIGPFRREEKGTRARRTAQTLPRRLVVQEDPRVVELAIEPFLYFAHHTQGALDLPAVCQHEERRIFTVG